MEAASASTAQGARSPRLTRPPNNASQSSLTSFTSYFGATSHVRDQHTMPSTSSADLDPISLIQKSFVPHIPVVASDDANELAQRKGFHSFFDMLRPFGQKVEGKVSVRDTNGQLNTISDFNVNFTELGPAFDMLHYGQSDLDRPGTRPKAQYMPGGDLVALERQIEAEMTRAGESIEQFEGQDASASTGSSQYYASFIQSLLSGLLTSPHETFAHPVASCIAISSHNDTPIQTLVALYKSGSEKLPSFVDKEFLRYYVLVHDEDEHSLDDSLQLFEKMKRSFGNHCHMLRLSSSKVTRENPQVSLVPAIERRSAPEHLRNKWQSGRNNSFINNAPQEDTTIIDQDHFLPDVDFAAMQALVRDMTVSSIAPYMERCIFHWNDQVAGPRRGLAGRFFKAGRSIFGASRTATPATGNGNYDSQTSSYPPTTPEAQLRRLADFAFMLRDWKLANNVYDMLRKDYSNDKAWRHHAGAQEMYIISLLLINQPITTKVRVDTIDPTLDAAMYSYLSRCSSPYSALRAILLTAELLRIRPHGAKDDAARYIMRAMDSQICGEMTRALLVERVATCFATGEGAVPFAARTHWSGSRQRKAAFWRILAAEHWSTIGKYRLARVALEEALMVYGNTELQSWVAIQGTIKMLKTETGLTSEFLLTPAQAEVTARNSAARKEKVKSPLSVEQDSAALDDGDALPEGMEKVEIDSPVPALQGEPASESKHVPSAANVEMHNSPAKEQTISETEALAEVASKSDEHGAAPSI
ncbi:ER-golgi trafficking TRAPP I complex 85 kDa subunit-domain-containing protein [Protomyces lactucae-debilis]|uniref:ER-golgi trafficking TRAPP I complex 85 kDa subunit-domain-containing protein n=1 Tax=Protomyces lactucae-debilis TaxID=2754530 RepID=A0A1Y2FBS2_PROLT|nr:ER-golgi trafficking TRAPP I complex 85 kDa subunit-domain-containing protein [Protomyces lactucae-debilis]ORY81369.1 ER-golgi trafficking TRAPP I complex 85 kDa subunit-domain-containing protein [Protomyces lactucae-debilis]